MLPSNSCSSWVIMNLKSGCSLSGLYAPVCIVGYEKYPYAYETKHEHGAEAGCDEQINEIAGDSVWVAVEHPQLVDGLC